MADEGSPIIKPRLAGIIWGSPKTGKTTYAFSSPGKKWIINLDPEGYMSVLDKIEAGEGELWDYSDQEPHRVIDIFTTKIGAKIDQAPIQEGDTVLFDSITVMNQFGLLTAIKNGVGSGKRGFVPTIEEPGISAYGARTQYLIACMGQVLRSSKRKGAHCWFIAHEDTPERNEKGDFLYQSILMSENAINQASGAISEIWRMRDLGNNGREVSVRSTSQYKPMGSRIFRMDGQGNFKLKYDPEKPDLEQPHSIASLWKAYRDGGNKKLVVPS